jgi:hypothetical protein
MWLEAAVISTMFAVGNIVFGHFEERTPKWRRLAKLALVMAVALGISAFFGRTWFWVFLAVGALPPLYIHLWWLPSQGINGWTGEPKEKYYALRGWPLPESAGHVPAPAEPEPAQPSDEPAR